MVLTKTRLLKHDFPVHGIFRNFPHFPRIRARRPSQTPIFCWGGGGGGDNPFFRWGGGGDNPPFPAFSAFRLGPSELQNAENRPTGLILDRL